MNFNRNRTVASQTSRVEMGAIALKLGLGIRFSNARGLANKI